MNVLKIEPQAAANARYKLQGVLLAGLLAFAAGCVAPEKSPEKSVQAPEEPRPVTLVVPGHSQTDPAPDSEVDSPRVIFEQELRREKLREDLAGYLTAADSRLKSELPAGWDTKFQFFRGRLPFQWSGDAGIGIRVDLVNRDGAPRLTRYLYYQLNAGFSQPMSSRIRPDRIYGITRDFVVIMPSSSTPEASYENRKLRPLFDRAFEVSDANTIRYAVRMPALPADPRGLSRSYPDRKAAIAGDPENQSTYALWVRTLR